MKEREKNKENIVNIEPRFQGDFSFKLGAGGPPYPKEKAPWDRGW